MCILCNILFRFIWEKSGTKLNYLNWITYYIYLFILNNTSKIRWRQTTNSKHLLIQSDRFTHLSDVIGVKGLKSVFQTRYYRTIVSGEYLTNSKVFLLRITRRVTGFSLWNSDWRACKIMRYHVCTVDSWAGEDTRVQARRSPDQQTHLWYLQLTLSVVWKRQH